MSWHYFFRVVHTGLRLGEADEFSGDHSTLVHQLIETVLAISAWFSENNGTSMVRESLSLQSDSFTVGFHIKLLNVGWESQQCLAIWQQSS